MGVLNSSTVHYFYCRVSNAIRGGFVRFIRQYVEQIPIPAAPPAERTALGGLVDRILKAKGTAPAADTSALEREIDERVYALYGLTADEIKLVEEAAR